MVEVEDVLESAGLAIARLANIALIVFLVSDLLGIDLWSFLRIAVTMRWWAIPREWVEMYYPLWLGLGYATLVLVIADTVYGMAYTQRTGELTTPPRYAAWMSLALFLTSFFPAIIFRYVSFLIINAFSAISFAYTAFVKGAEAGGQYTERWSP